jgi:hypothetical protein
MSNKKQYHYYLVRDWKKKAYDGMRLFENYEELHRLFFASRPSVWKHWCKAAELEGLDPNEEFHFPRTSGRFAQISDIEENGKGYSIYYLVQLDENPFNPDTWGQREQPVLENLPCPDSPHIRDMPVYLTYCNEFESYHVREYIEDTYSDWGKEEITEEYIQEDMEGLPDTMWGVRNWLEMYEEMLTALMPHYLPFTLNIYTQIMGAAYDFLGDAVSEIESEPPSLAEQEKRRLFDQFLQDEYRIHEPGDPEPTMEDIAEKLLQAYQPGNAELDFWLPVVSRLIIGIGPMQTVTRIYQLGRRGSAEDEQD